jgi:phage terminase large subunit-like protein
MRPPSEEAKQIQAHLAAQDGEIAKILGALRGEGPRAAGSRKSAPWQRVVVAIAATSSDAQETGIIAAALGLDDHCYVLADHSGRYPVERWGSYAR